MKNIKNKSSIKNEFVDQIGDNITKIKNMFKDVKNDTEFEFIFFGRKGRYLSQEKYIQILSFLNSRNNLQIVQPYDMLDIIYNYDTENIYRCSIYGSTNINKIMKKMSMMKNHVIFRTLTEIYESKEYPKSILSVIKKEKNIEHTIDIDDFDLRVRSSKELELTKKDFDIIKNINETSMRKIRYRYKQRTSAYVLGSENSSEFVRIDVTYTKMNEMFKKLNHSIPNYELEVEYGTKTKSRDEDLNIVLYEVNLLLKVIQQSNYIISRSISEKVLEYYASLFILNLKEQTALNARQTTTLEIQYATEKLPNAYAVTDKADGERHFLIIYEGSVYLISTNLNVKNTGIKIQNKLSEYNGSVLDGELIFIADENRHIFLAFDCLFHKNIDIRSKISLFERLKYADDIIDKCFVFDKQKGFKYVDDKEYNLDKNLEFYRNQIKSLISNLNNDIKIEKQFLLVRRKYFIGCKGVNDWEIFAYASTMWECFTEDPNVKCPYILDGLIFQAMEQAYITNVKESKLHDYKWKPQDKNSIDFYIEFEKDNDGKMLSVYDNSYENFNLNKTYRICKLHVGYRNKNKEEPILFKENDELYYAYLLLNNGEVRDLDDNIISDKTVVEFYYNTDPETLERFKWVAMRTRYDKTESVARFGKKYGNYYSVADKVWNSIVNPVLMSDFTDLAKGNNPEKNLYFYDKKLAQLRNKIGHELIVLATKENAYFQKKTNLAKPLRNLHNWFKSSMIYTVCHPMYQDNRQLSVLDIACGKGQDIMKFYHTSVAFYVGIDIDREGLVSAVDGAISRYNQLRTKNPNFPKMYFIQADATADLSLTAQRNALNVKKLENEDFFNKFFSDNVEKRTLFDRINCQFAIHYMLRNDDTWKNFKKNINDYLRNDGYLMVSTFDADKVMKLLGNNDNFIQYYNDQNGDAHVLFEIVRKYQVPANDNVIMGTGNAIDVYISWFSQEGRYLTEYLVDGRYIVKNLKDDCNLELVDSDNFGNQYIIHEPYIKDYIKYEEVPETRKFLENVAEFYKQNNLNDGCRIWNALFRYYVFRKNTPQKQKKQTGGGYDNMINFSDGTRFYIPSMDNYNNEFSCMNSIHQILHNHSIIPKSICMNKLYKDIGIKIISDIDIQEKLSKICNKIIIEHDLGRNRKDKVINGLNIFVVERNCNDIYDIDLYSSTGQYENRRASIILMKEGTWYVPVYSIEDGKKLGLFGKNHYIIDQLLREI